MRYGLNAHVPLQTHMLKPKPPVDGIGALGEVIGLDEVMRVETL